MICVSKQASDDFIRVWNEVLVRDGYHKTAEGRAAKAIKVQILVDAFYISMCGLTGSHGCNFYTHSMKHHLSDMIATCPMHLMDLSGQGIEQVNQVTKRVFK